VSRNFPYATVTEVVDGDTIDAAIDLGFRVRYDVRVRLAGIDAPEVRAKGPEGEAARDWLRARLPVGTPVVLVTDKPSDKYGRYLAWVFEGLDNVNAEIVAAGHARPYDGGARTAA
jgi:micrococcal nuclease